LTEFMVENEADSALVADMAEIDVKPLWRLYKTLNTRVPRFLKPMHWPWSVMEPLVSRASRDVSMAEAERRALMLTHPDMGGTTFTTPTLSAALQILEPGEEAHAHRHTLAALRMVMTGDGAITTTNGKQCLMEPGDLVLTPSGTWHKHHHPGKERAVWFDGLDAPMCTTLGTVFFDHGPGPEDNQLAPAELDVAFMTGGVLPQSELIAHQHPYSPVFRYPWGVVRDALQAMAAAPDGSRRIRYVNPRDGGPVMPTIDCFALRLESGLLTKRARTTATAICVVIEGEGTSRIGEREIVWTKHDVFTMPRWLWAEHIASSPTASIFMMTDRALMANIGHLREEVDAV
jgi:gentisate 1,2-dioxygenase